MTEAAVALQEAMLLSYADLQPALSAESLAVLWAALRPLLCGTTQGDFLATLLGLAATLLEETGDAARFLFEDLLQLLPATLERPNERCRAASCRCLGWLCQVFPAVRKGGMGDCRKWRGVSTSQSSAFSAPCSVVKEM